MSEGSSPLLERLARLAGQLEDVRQPGIDDRESFLRFEALVGEIAALDPPTVPTLLRFLDDNLDLDLAFGIIHSVERFDCPTYVPLLLEALPALQAESQEWAETCLLRVLNSESCFGLAVLLQLVRCRRRTDQSVASGLHADNPAIGALLVLGAPNDACCRPTRPERSGHSKSAPK